MLGDMGNYMDIITNPLVITAAAGSAVYFLSNLFGDNYTPQEELDRQATRALWVGSSEKSSENRMYVHDNML